MPELKAVQAEPHIEDEVERAHQFLAEHAPALLVDPLHAARGRQYRTELEIEMNRLRGRLLGLLESFGLDDRHERACKNTLKSLSYDMQAALANILDREYGDTA